MGWSELWQETADAVGIAVFVLVFPVYHSLLPLLRRLGARYRAGKRLEREVEDWTDLLLEEGKAIVGVQQARNTTMVATLLASSTLILIGLIGNLVLTLPSPDAVPEMLADPVGLRPKLVIAVAVLAIAFSSFLSCVGLLGKFTICIGVRREMLDRMEGSGSRFLAALFMAAARSYRLGVRWLYAIFSIVFWLFSPWLFLALTILWGIKFVFLEDFVYLVRRRRRGEKWFNLYS